MPNDDNIRLIEILSALNALQANGEKIDNKLFQLDQLLQKTREEQIQKITELQIEARALADIKISVQMNTENIDKLEETVRENDAWIKGEITRREKRSDMMRDSVSSITVNGITQAITLLIMLLLLGWSVFRDQYIIEPLKNPNDNSSPQTLNPFNELVQ